jgi:hypothetical protein
LHTRPVRDGHRRDMVPVMARYGSRRGVLPLLGRTAHHLHAVRSWVPTTVFAAAMFVPASDAAEIRPQDLEFNVVREGVVVGHHRITFRQDDEQGDERLLVRSELKIEVKLLLFTAYRYQQTRSEVWRGREIIALDSVTDDDGTPYSIEGQAGPDGIKVTSGRKSWTLPVNSVPASYWNVSMVTAKGPLIDAQSGRVLDARVSKIGEETIEAGGKKIIATHYRLGVERPRDIWYDAHGRWVKMRATGRDGSVAEWVLK